MRISIIACLLAVLGLVLVACGGPSPPPTPQTLPGWNLTLPVAGDNGRAEQLEPAAVAPPWLVRGPGGELTFWAPVDGATTRNSEHARTELVGQSTFPAGSGGQQQLRASVTVHQVPSGEPDVIIGQLHGAGDSRSVAFVMLHYDAGEVRVVVKQQRTGDDAQPYPLLSGVPLDARFDYGISDDGDGNLTFTAQYGEQRASVRAPLPAAFRDMPVRFQAGAYQQGDSESGGAVPNDGARVTFSTLTASGQ